MQATFSAPTSPELNMEEILHEATTTDVMDEVNLDTVQNGHDASCQPLPAADPIFLSDAANEMDADDMNDDNNVDDIADIADIGDFNAVGHANVSETEIMTPNDDSSSHATSSMPTVDHFMIDETTTTSTTPPPAIQDKDISDIPKNEEDGSTDIPIEPVTVTVPDVDVSHQPEDLNEVDHPPPPPSIGIDCTNDTAIPTDRLEDVDVDTTTTDNVMTTVVPPVNQIDLGDVDTTIVQPLSENDTSAENVNQEDFSVFHDTTPLPTVTKTSDFVPMVEDDHDHRDNDEEDDFGDFDDDDDNAAAAPMDATIPNPNATMNQGDNDFGHFDVVTLSTTTSPEVVVIETNHTNIDDDDDDFGDFGTAEAPPMTNEPIPVHDNDDYDDDDDFGDFDEAPVSVPTTNADAVHESSTSRSAIPSDGIDPIMVKVRNTFSNMFIRYAREENIAATTLENNNDDIPIIPQFDSDEIITIESVLVRSIGKRHI